MVEQVSRLWTIDSVLKSHGQDSLEVSFVAKRTGIRRVLRCRWTLVETARTATSALSAGRYRLQSADLFDSHEDAAHACPHP